MSSSKQKREKIKVARDEKKLSHSSKTSKAKDDLEEFELMVGLKKGTIIAVDRSKVFSRSVLPEIPDYYRDSLFTCKDCGEQELWTAKQQQRWYEEQGGEIEAVAIRCHACRSKEKLRRDIARRTHLEGISKKQNSRSQREP
ncbi:MAG: hypothetical protein CFE26_18535 [Verrucomicrobiales bacterium VVV1]|nr:MAG: hypothetical protein CFE26_18535 [Verrucomicrobiales bacterium VVV1]